MGQKEAIRQLRVPSELNEEARDQVLEQLKETAGKVVGIRDWFQASLAQVGRSTELRRGAPPAIRRRMEDVTRSRIRFMRFSDTMVLFMPLGGIEIANAAANVYSLMFSVASCLLPAMAARTPIRGGIELGAGINLGKDEIYGSALERAYQLESEFADYPRVLIGTELLGYIDSLRHIRPTTPEEELAKGFACEASGLIAFDDDRLPTLDYLSQHVVDMTKSLNIADLELFRRGFEFAKHEHARFSYKRNLKLASRYGRLMSYYERRAELWGETDLWAQRRCPNEG